MQESRTAADADQVELAAIRGASSVVDQAAQDELVSGELDDDSEIAAAENRGGGENARTAWQERDLAQEEIVGAAAQEIRDRIQHLGSAYPFQFQGNKLAYTPSQTGFYEFCLATATAPTITADPFTSFPKYFERVVAVLVKIYFGPKKGALHTGWPRVPTTRFRQALAPMARNSKEWVWSPEEGLDEDPPYTVVKDETVDFIVTANMMDARPGNLYILGQCACGNNWDTKLQEPDLERIRKWFKPPWLVPPVKAFTTPFVFGAETIRETSRNSKAIVFDRVRLVLIAENLMPSRYQISVQRRLAPITNLVTSIV
ncbi:hypothetical protein [Lysobacter capsici]|uniref:hypothetical protein n=1 Tax=Lysobacter capsici TaxID=435897 RepID=UPI001C0050EB|nr:hypothetical protein [Lysobacter capsici]QWF17725.1 hypothetical protein KME82_02715 [Lysobacter capsici]